MCVIHQFNTGDKISEIWFPQCMWGKHCSTAGLQCSSKNVEKSSCSSPNRLRSDGGKQQVVCLATALCNSWNELQCYSTVSMEWGLEETLHLYCKVYCETFACSKYLKDIHVVLFISNETSWLAFPRHGSFHSSVHFVPHWNSVNNNTCDYLKH